MKHSGSLRVLVLVLILFCAPASARTPMPYAEAGMSEREAAAHLLSRFTYGARPGQVDEVVKMGLENWLASQLRAQGREPEVTPVSNLNGLRHRRLRRAVHSQNQLKEVMTDFWFNHFNVSARSVNVRWALADYEENAIRANALGRFEDLLKATAHHPAMLTYLNNDRSRADPGSNRVQVNSDRDPLNYGPRRSGPRNNGPMNYGNGLERPKEEPKPIGINENYARELMELHTLGVDGGYQQRDVIEVARALTGWTVDRSEREKVWKFRFNDDIHDKRAKQILKRNFPGGQGQQEGEKVLEILARHGSTARHLSHKLAVRFVSDEPPAALVRRLERRFLGTGGNTALVLDELVRCPEFWKSRGEKIKTPLELTVGAIRALDGQLNQSGWLQNEMATMGQPLYEYDPPTGFPDRADHWINPGTLTARINYGLQLARGGVSGVNIPAPDGEGAGASNARQALKAQIDKVLPGRDQDKILKQLVPVVEDHEFEKKIQKKSKRKTRVTKLAKFDQRRILGILLGSPEFQRR